MFVALMMGGCRRDCRCARVRIAALALSVMLLWIPFPVMCTPRYQNVDVSS